MLQYARASYNFKFADIIIYKINYLKVIMCNLAERLKDFIDVPRDGNCMFTSIALQLGRSISAHMEIRKEVVDFMRIQREVVGVFQMQCK